MQKMYDELLEKMNEISQQDGTEFQLFVMNPENLDVEGLITTQQEISFGMAFDLAMMGHVVRRADEYYGFTVQHASNGCQADGGTPDYEAFVCDKQLNPTTERRHFNVRDLMATDFTVLK